MEKRYSDKKKTDKPLPEKEDRSFLLWAMVIQSSFQFLSTGIKYSTFVACFYIVYLIIDSIGEHLAIAEFFKSVNKHGFLTLIMWILLFLFGSGGVTYGVLQRKEKNKTIKRIAPKKIEEQKKLDPGRSSSKIAESGQSQKEEKV